MDKIIILDWGIFGHRSGYATAKNPMPVKWICMTSIIACLKIIGVNSNDTIIVACDGRGNWRKAYEDQYKSGRTKQREESGLDWNKIYAELDYLLDDIEIATNWSVIKIPKIEADDIMAVASRYYEDKEVILVTYDTDMEQLWKYPNVKIFSQHPKKKAYKIPKPKFNAYELISKKIYKEISDGLTKPILNKEDYKARELVVNLLTLPEFVENPILEALKDVSCGRLLKLHLLPGSKLKERFMEIYENKHIVTYEQQVEKMNKRKERDKNKKDKLKKLKNCVKK